MVLEVAFDSVQPSMLQRADSRYDSRGSKRSGGTRRSMRSTLYPTHANSLACSDDNNSLGELAPDGLTLGSAFAFAGSKVGVYPSYPSSLLSRPQGSPPEESKLSPGGVGGATVAGGTGMRRFGVGGGTS